MVRMPGESPGVTAPSLTRFAAMTPAPVKLPVSVAVPAVRVPSMLLAPALV